MANQNLSALPYIIEVLNRSCDYSETTDNLYKEVRKMMANENQLNQCENIRRQVDDALLIGQSLGIIYRSNRLVRLGFSLRLKRKNI